METGAGLINRERQRQIDEKGWTSKHDNMHRGHELCYAAAAYILTIIEPDGDHYKLWPWDMRDFNPTVKKFQSNDDDEIRQLVKAGALIAAEIDRLQRFKKLLEGAEEAPKGSFLNP